MNEKTIAQPSVAGEYYLRGVTEVGSGFLLKPDSTFQFFFSYGALDREGSGTWQLKEKEIIFNSKERPDHDFALIESKKTSDNFITVRITDSNSLLLRYVYAKMEFRDSTIEKVTNNEGEIQFPKKEIKKLSLIFQFCPEKVSVFNPGNEYNYFEFRFEPWLAEYFFSDFHLRLEGKDMKGKHPLLDEKEYLFIKAK
jgi:hypothetical protein